MFVSLLQMIVDIYLQTIYAAEWEQLTNGR